jgi:hypothetical protein
VKTISLKKVSAVAVASLGFGLLSVVPANAAFTSQTFTAVVTSTPAAATNTTPAAAGTPVVLDLKTTLVAGAAGAAVAQTATYGLFDPNGTDVTSSATFATNATTITNLTKSNVAHVYTLGIGVGLTAAVHLLGTVTYTPAMGGQYLLKVTTTAITVTDAHTALSASTISTMFVSGAGAKVAASGIGTTTVGGVTGGNAKIDFCMAAHTTGDVYNLISSGVGTIQTVAQGTTTVGVIVLAGIAAAADFTQGAKATAAGDTLECTLATVSSAVAGTQTLKWTAINASTGAPTTVATATVTWGAVPAVSATYSTAFINSGTAFPAANWDPAVAIVRTAGAGAAQATISITLKDDSQTAIAGAPLTAVITGPGLITLTAGTGTGATGTVRAQSLTGAQMPTNLARIGITADGSAGVGTITISSGTTVLATKTVTFFGSVATLTATQVLSVAKSGTTGGTLGTAVAAPAGTTVATTPAVIIVAKDSSGNVVPGLVITAVSSDATVLSGATIVESNGLGVGDGLAGLGSYNASVTSAPASVSGKTATITFRTINPADGVSFISTAAIKFTLGGAVSTGTVTAAFDKSSYATGEAAVLTYTAKDSAGNPVFDQDVNFWGGLGTAVVFSKSVNGSTPSAAATAMFKSGVKTYKMFAPAQAGAFSATGALDTLTVTAGGSVSAASSVVDGNAAIATSIASLNAKIVALNALIAKIMKRLNIR